MPYKKKSHEECRKMVCAVCWCESGAKATRGVSEAEVTAIREFVVSSYTKADPRFPSGLCKGCHFILREWSIKKENPRPLPVTNNFQAKMSITTRSTTSCSCTICSLARMNGNTWKTFVSNLTKNKTPFHKKSGDKLCPKCFSRIYSGSNHNFNACRSKSQALQSLTIAANPRVLEQAVHGHLQAVAGSSGDQTIKITSAKGGKPMSVTIGDSSNLHTPDHLSAEDILAIQDEASLSDR